MKGMDYLYVTLIALASAGFVVAINNRYRIPFIGPAEGDQFHPPEEADS